MNVFVPFLNHGPTVLYMKLLYKKKIKTATTKKTQPDVELKSGTFFLPLNGRKKTVTAEL